MIDDSSCDYWRILCYFCICADWHWFLPPNALKNQFHLGSLQQKANHVVVSYPRGERAMQHVLEAWISEKRYPFSHNPGSGKWLYLKGNYWGDPFFASMIMGGRVSVFLSNLAPAITIEQREQLHPSKIKMPGRGANERFLNAMWQGFLKSLLWTLVIYSPTWSTWVFDSSLWDHETLKEGHCEEYQVIWVYLMLANGIKDHRSMWYSFTLDIISRWWFQICFIFTPTWGDNPIWLKFFNWVETTNKIHCFQWC